MFIVQDEIDTYQPSSAMLAITLLHFLLSHGFFSGFSSSRIRILPSASHPSARSRRKRENNTTSQPPAEPKGLFFTAYYRLAIHRRGEHHSTASPRPHAQGQPKNPELFRARQKLGYKKPELFLSLIFTKHLSSNN